MPANASDDHDDYSAFLEWRAEKAEQEAADRRQAKADEIDYANTPHPHTVARDVALGRQGDGATREEGMAAAFSTLVKAGAAGDKRVLIDSALDLE